MKPKEKAIELIELFYKFNFDIRPFSELGYWNRDAAKKCALIAVDEILSNKKEILDDFHSEYFQFWKEVKQEIEKL